MASSGRPAARGGSPARRVLLLGLLVLAVFGVGATALLRFGPLGSTAGAQRANVVVIVTDDMRHDGLLALSSLNRLAERGTTFTRFFATTPLCCPSRATLMTGRYARNHGVLANSPPQGGVEAFDDRSTLATWLRAAGVRTGLAGRYLNGYASLDIPPGWDHWFAIWQADEEHGSYYDYRANDNGTRRYFASQPRDYSTRVVAEQAQKFLAADPSRPFLLMLTPRAPHGPATPDPRDSGIFKVREFPLPPSLDEEDVSDKPANIRRLQRLELDELEDVEVFRRRQWESLVAVDRMLEGVVDTLQADGRLARTWIIFTSDNGLALGEHRLDTRKSCVYEECARVPLVIIPPPGVSVPRTVDRVVANIDLAPTVAEILGARPERPTDGRSLLPLLANPAAEWRDGVVLEMQRDAGSMQFVAIRTADRKYVRHEDGDEELYDETADPYELDNRASDPAWADEKARLAKRLDELLDGS